jgi:hypothetical protein
MSAPCANFLGILLMVLPVLCFQWLALNPLGDEDEAAVGGGRGEQGTNTNATGNMTVVEGLVGDEYDENESNDYNYIYHDGITGNDYYSSSSSSVSQRYQTLCLILGGIGGILYSRPEVARPYGFVWCAGMLGGAVFSTVAFQVSMAAMEYNQEAMMGSNPSAISVMSFLVGAVPAWIVYAIVKGCSDYTFPEDYYQPIPNGNTSTTTTEVAWTASNSQRKEQASRTTSSRWGGGGPSYEALSQFK